VKQFRVFLPDVFHVKQKMTQFFKNVSRETKIDVILQNVSRETQKSNIFEEICASLLKIKQRCDIITSSNILRACSRAIRIYFNERTAKMAKIIAFANQKGGVGKTTSAVNVASSLGVIGFRTLIIDLDPQGNTTSGVGVAKKGLKNTTRELLLGEITAKEAIIQTPYTNLSVIPTNVSLASAEFDLFDFSENEYRLKTVLEEVQNDFDYIIIDCPPSLGMLTINALSACDGVVVPMQCEFYALEGLSQLLISIKRINKLYNSKLSVCGILVTMHNPRLLLSTQVIGELKKHYADKLFATTISRNVKLSEAPSHGKPVYYHDKRAKATLEYIAVAKELSERI